MSYKATKELMITASDEELSPAESRMLWNVPDWRIEAAYLERILPQKRKPTKHVELSPDQWRWEFLRRDSDYREDYEAACRGMLPYAVCERNDPNIEPKTQRGKKREAPLHYDMASMLAPNLSWRDVPDKIFLQRCRGGRITSANAGDINQLINNPRYGLLAFDIHRPLAEQIIRAQDSLYKLQDMAARAEHASAKAKGRTAHRRGTIGEDEVIVNSRLSDDYRHLLRLLDAYMEGASAKEIDATLYPKFTKAEAHTKRNKDMRKALHMYLWL